MISEFTAQALAWSESRPERWVFAGCAVSVALLVAMIVAGSMVVYFFSDFSTGELEYIPRWIDILGIVVVAPISETFIWQFFVIEISLVCGARSGVATLVSVTAFAAAHFFSSMNFFSIIPGLFGGAFLACAYVWYRCVSVAKAFAFTLMVHVTSNSLILILIFICRVRNDVFH